MPNKANHMDAHAEHPPISTWMIILLATACGLIVANLYYAQPLISLIAPEIGLSNETASFIVTLTQGGYCLGLLLLVPLGDLVENRKLITVTLTGVIFALLLAITAPSLYWFLSASLFIGISTVVVQMLVPVAAHLAPDAIRGQVVGKVMSGLLAGIMLSRPISSLVANIFGWRAVFAASAVLMFILMLVLRHLLPKRKPKADHSYFSLIASLWTLLIETPVLRRRAAYHAALFASFTLFWTIVPIVLVGPKFGFSQGGVALFALAGVLGVLAAPVAGKMADRGLTKIATGLSLGLVAFSFLLGQLGTSGSIVALLAAGILLDLGVQSNLVLGQRSIYALGAHVRSRLNALYMAIFFAGGAIGSSIASVSYTYGGWSFVCWIGFAFPVAALILFATEKN